MKNDGRVTGVPGLLVSIITLIGVQSGNTVIPLRQSETSPHSVDLSLSPSLSLCVYVCVYLYISPLFLSVTVSKKADIKHGCKLWAFISCDDCAEGAFYTS